MTFFTIFFQMLALLIMIGAGVFAARKGILDAHTNSGVSGMIADIFNPILIVSSAANSVGLASTKQMGMVAVIATGMFLFLIVVGMLIVPFFEKDAQQRKIFQMMVVFSNLGFIGIPVVTSILGAEYVVYVTVFILINTIFIYTYGLAVMDGNFSLSSMKAIVNPGTICSLVAVFIIVFHVQVPDFMKTAFSYLGNATSPLALMAVGYTLTHCDFKMVFCQPRLYVFSAVKLLVLPFLMLPILCLFTDDASLLPVCTIMFGMPIGNMPLILANQKEMDGKACGAAIILSTLLCVITIPVLLTVAGWLTGIPMADLS